MNHSPRQNLLSLKRGSRFFRLPARLCLLAGLVLFTGSLSLFAAEGVSTNSSATPVASKVVAAPAEPSAAAGKVIAAPAPEAEPATPAAEIAPTNAMAAEPAPELGALPTPGAITPVAIDNSTNLQDFQMKLDFAREQRRAKDLASASLTLVSILETNAPTELKRLALFELALAAQDDNKLVKAQQIFAQYIHSYPEDPSVPEVLLRQGLIYRQMGVTTLAISKFYAVMSSALKLKLDNIDYYKKLVLQAQIEIADTYYLEGKYEESSDFYSRILKASAPDLDKVQIQYKLIRSLSFLPDSTETVAKAQVFLDLYTNSSEVPEVRFVLASALKKLDRNHEAMKQVLLLLQSQEENVRKNPQTWIYWHDIANQLYKEGDYMSALQIYLSLADLNKTPGWQLPVWYQAALVYEQLQQWQKATETYDRILGRQKELTPEISTPTLVSLLEMSKWRKDYIDWMQKAKLSNQAYQPSPPPSPPAPANP